MFALYKSELQRFALLASTSLALLLAAYLMLPKMGLWDILHRNMGFLLTVGSIIVSLVFGIVHALLWKKKNFWVFLIHRPLDSRKIYLSLMLAGITLLISTISLSLLITTLGYDNFTNKVVDWRHYQFIGYLTLLNASCYMVGTLSVLHRSRFAILVFYTLFIAFFPEPKNTVAQYVPLVFMLCALFYLNIKSFKPDLNKPLDTPLATGLLATGVSYSVVIVLILATTVFYHLPMMAIGKHPDMNPVDGTRKLIWENNFENAVGYILEGSRHAQAAHYANQAKLADVMSLPVTPWQSARKNQLHRFDNQDAIVDPDTRNVWKFSHDEMLLIGVDGYSGKSLGAIGRGGFLASVNDAKSRDRFEFVPHLSQGKFLSTPDGLYSIDFETKSLLVKHRPNAGERYISALWLSEQVGRISTSTQLLMFNRNTLYDDFAEFVVDYQFVYPASVSGADTAYGLKVADGYLLIFTGEHYFGFDRPGAEVFITRLDGSSEKLGEREFNLHSLPGWVRHYNFIVAPFIFVSEELLAHFIDPFESRYMSFEDIKNQHYPLYIWVVAALLQFASVLVLWRLTRALVDKASLRLTWRVLGMVLGLPALLSFVLLQPLRRS